MALSRRSADPEEPTVEPREPRLEDFVRPLARRAPRRKRGLRRTAVRAAAFLASILCLVGIAGGLFLLRLTQGPIALDIKPQILAALNDRVGLGYAFTIEGTSIAQTDHGPALTIDSLSVQDGMGRPVVTAPKATISVDPMGLLSGRISPRQLELSDIELQLVILKDGQVGVSAGTAQGAAFPLATAFRGALPMGPYDAAIPGPGADVTASLPNEPPTNAAVRAITAALRSVVDATTAPDGAIGALERVNVTGRLVLDDRTHNTKTVFTNTELSFDKSADGSAMLQVAADGPAGRWSIVARSHRDADASKTMTVEFRDVSLDEITLAGGLRDLGFDFDMPVSAKVGFKLTPDGDLADALGHFSLGSGYFKLDDPDHEPLLIDSADGDFHFDIATRRILIDRMNLRAGESVFDATGFIEPPRSANQIWRFQADASGIFGTERPGEKPIKISHVGLEAHLFPLDRRLRIDKAEVTGPDVTYSGTTEVRQQDGGFLLTGTHTVKSMPAQALVRLWPSFIAAPVRAWFLQNCRGGRIDSGTATVSLTDKDLALMRAQHSVPDDHVHVDYTVSDLDLSLLPGLPILSNLYGTGTVTGHVARFTASRGSMEIGPGRTLTLADGGTFFVPDTDPKPTPAVVNAKILGTVEAAADILSRDALKPFANVPIDASAVKGQLEAELQLNLKLGEHVPPDETKVAVSAKATNVAVDKLIGKEGLVDTTIRLKADKNGILAKGEGRMFGGPATLELKKPPGGAASEATINLSLDDAARVKAGVNLGKALTGLVTAKISTSLTTAERNRANVELDFAGASIDGPVPGFVKPNGKPAKATLTVLQRDGGATLDNIQFDSGAAMVRGSAEVDSSGNLVSAKLTQARLSPGDDLKADINQSQDALKVSVKAANLDARPFLKWLNAGSSGGGGEGTAEGKTLDLDLHAAVLTGQNAQAVTGADIRLVRRGKDVKKLDITGRLGRQRLSIATTDSGGKPHFVVTSYDGGATLAFMDIYKRMTGGRLNANFTVSDSRVEGIATIRDFTLKDDPAMRKLTTESAGAPNRNLGNASTSFDAGSISFTKLQAHFVKTGNRVEFTDGAMFGPEAGATVEGSIDFARDQVNLSGTFVPIYGINNLFSQIPLFGPLLGGGAHEGLFGVNYRISGSATAPVLSVNPLSAVAPGFLRKILSAFDDAAQGRGPPRDRAAGPVEQSRTDEFPAAGDE